MSIQNIDKLFKCFCGYEEYNDFMRDLVSLNASVLEILHSENTENVKEHKEICHAKSLFLISLFFKENIEVIRDLANTIDFKVVDGDDKEL